MAMHDLAVFKPVLPTSIGAAQAALTRMERDVDSAATYAELQRLKRAADAIRILFAEVDAVRQQAERTVLLAKRRCGEELAKAPRAIGSRGQLIGPGVIGPAHKAEPIATLAEQVGSAKRGANLKQLASIPREAILAAADALHARGKEATATAVVKYVHGEATRERREASRAALPVPDGMDLRIGDCRLVLADVPDNSVPLILTDPPYGDEAEPLYQWLAQWASRVLIPGGSLVCYTGQAQLIRDGLIFAEHLRYWWTAAMLHDQSQRLAGKFVIANFKPVLWFVKEFRRGRSLVPDVLRAVRDKTLHEWAQGDGGVQQWIEHLTDPGELVVDPFAGAATWGRLAHTMGRRWIGADIAKGGSTLIAA